MDALASSSSSDENKTVVFFCSHHSGHINPVISLVKLFRQANWTVHFFGFEQSRKKIESVTDHFHSVSDLTLTDGAIQTLEKKFNMSHVPDNVKLEFFPEQILAGTVHIMDPSFKLVERVQALHPRAIVSDVSALWGVFVAKLLNLPLITSCSCTLFPSLEPAFGYLRDLDFMQKSSQWIHEQYPGLGDQVYDPMLSYMNESDFTISWSCPQFQPPERQAEGGAVRFFGAALVWDDGMSFEDAMKQEREKDLTKEDGDSIVRWLEAGKKAHPDRKVIYCSMGTVVGQEPWTKAAGGSELNKDGDMIERLYRNLIQAVGSNDDYQCIISIGKERTVDDLIQRCPGKSLPSNIKCLNFVPQVLVLNEADVFITHCGNNGVHEAFYTGCPMLCIPVFGDQHPNAQQIENIKVGVQIASPFAPAISENLDHATSEVISEKLSEILSSTEIAESCKRLSKSMRGHNEHLHKSAMSEMVSFINRHEK